MTGWPLRLIGCLFCLLPREGLQADDSSLPLDHEQARGLVAAGVILPLEQLLRNHPSTRQGRILELELEFEHGRYWYEIEWVDPAGRVRKEKWDAASGTMRKQKLKE